MTKFGIPEEVIAAEIAQMEGADRCEIHADNWLAARAFFALSSQWRVVGMGNERQGIDYAAIQAVFALLPVPKKQRPAMFGELRVMEQAALRAWAKQRPVSDSPPPAPNRA